MFLKPVKLQTSFRGHHVLYSAIIGAGNINRIEDVKKLLYAGCLQVIFNATKDSSLELANVASEKFGKDKILLSISNVDYIFKHLEEIEDTFHELCLYRHDIIFRIIDKLS